jgi:tubulin-specific chaperone D
MPIARSIAAFEDYRQPIMRHLFTAKLFHWDIAIRTLTSASLANMAALDPQFLGNVAMPFLLTKSLDDKNLYVRHGAVLGTAEITLALSELEALDSSTTDETRTDLIALVSLIEKNRLYRGRGGEIMRSAVCRLIECISIARIPLIVKDQVRLLDSADASIPHPSEEIRQCACRALEQLLNVYFPVHENGPSPRLQARVVDKFVDLLKNSNNVAVTRGYALALGYLPPKILAPNRSVLDAILSCLMNAAHPNALVAKEGDAETRRNALLSLARIAKVVPTVDPVVSGIYPLAPLHIDQLSSLFDTFFRSLGDYKRDRRGDVGSWCRVAAMEGLTDLLQVCIHSSCSIKALGKSAATAAVCELLKQLSEKLGNVRLRAAHCLWRILLHPDIPGICHKAKLIVALELDSSVEHNWSDPCVAFPKLVKAVSITCSAERTVDGVAAGYCYRDSIISGLVISAGDLTESVSKQASLALLSYAKSVRGTPELQGLGQCLLSLMNRHRGDGRVMLPLLKTLNKLFSNQCLDILVASDSKFAEYCLQNLRDEERICVDVHRLLAIADLAAALLSTPLETSVEQGAIAFLCQLMGHSFPRVRGHTSQQLYIVLLNRTEQLPSDIALHDLVLNTPWASDIDAEDIHRAVDEISIGLRVDGFLVPVMSQATACIRTSS